MRRGSHRPCGRLQGARRVLPLLVACSIAAAAGVSRAQSGANPSVKRPDPWFLSVSHRIDLSSTGARVAAPVGQNARTLINLTSGLLIDTDGHVVTRLLNLDPTAAQQDLKVTTSTGLVLNASFVGLDGPTGLAVLSVPELKGRQPAPVPDAPTIAAGADVRVVSPFYTMRQISAPVERVAMYPELRIVDATLVSPATAESTRRTGVLSALESRQLSTSDDLSTVESAKGQLIGLVRYVAPGRGDVLSLEFVCGVVARRVIAAAGSVQAGWLGAVGMSLREVPADRRPSWASSDGVLIEMISSKGPADTAGLQLNDLVTGIDGMKVRSTSDMAMIVTSTPAGTRIDLAVVRDGSPITVSPVLGGKPLAVGSVPVSMPNEVRYAELRKLALQNQLARANDEASRARIREQIAQVDREIDLMRSATRVPTGAVPSASGIGAVGLGLTIRPAPPQVAKLQGVKAGLFVDDVAAGSKAEAAGIRATDIVVQVGDIKVADPADFDGALRAAAAAGAAFVDVAIVRDGQPTSARIQLAAPPKP